MNYETAFQFMQTSGDLVLTGDAGFRIVNVLSYFGQPDAGTVGGVESCGAAVTPGSAVGCLATLGYPAILAEIAYEPSAATGPRTATLQLAYDNGVTTAYSSPVTFTATGVTRPALTAVSSPGLYRGSIGALLGANEGRDLATRMV